MYSRVTLLSLFLLALLVIKSGAYPNPNANAKLYLVETSVLGGTRKEDYRRRSTGDDECVTNGGNQSGAKCIFPFIYRGVKYNGCTSFNHNRPWCATIVDDSGINANWGNCASTCKFHGEGITWMTISIRGKIIMPAMEAFTFPEKSTVLVKFLDLSVADVAEVIYGNTTIDLSNKSSKEEICYSIEAEIPSYLSTLKFSVSALMNTHRDPNGDSWINKGDFMNAMRNNIQMKEGVSKYEKDIIVEEH